MNTAAPAIHNLARRLLTLEAARDPSDGLIDEAARACEKLRVLLAKYLGVAGFQSLMARGLALATAELPWLEPVQVRADGSLAGFDATGLHQSAVPTGEAGVVVVAKLLELLASFIGEPLTRRFVRDAWPNASLAEMDAENGNGV